MKKKLLALLMVLALLLGLTACSDLLEEEEWEELWDDPETTAHTDREEDYGDPDQTWAIYWYLCGTDLESDGGAATEDLGEMMDAELPENVKVVIQTGGASCWENDVIDPDYTERYLYASDGLTLLEQQPISNMGDPETLADFLRFCQENYPADRTMVLFWDHGGGSVYGAVSDENFDPDRILSGLCIGLRIVRGGAAL